MLKKVTHTAFSVFIFLLPLFFLPLPFGSLDQDRHFFLYVFTSVFAFIYLLHLRKEKKFVFSVSPPDIFFLAMAVLSALSAWLHSANKASAVFAPSGVLSLVSVFLLYFFLSRLPGFPGSHPLRPFVYSSALLSILIIIQEFIKINYLAPLVPYLTSAYLLSAALIFCVFDICCSGEKKSVRKYSSLVIPAIPVLIISSGLFIILFRFFTDARPILLPYSFGWIMLMEIYKNWKYFLIGTGPGSFPSFFSILKPAEINRSLYWNLNFNTSSSQLLTFATELGALYVLAFFLFGKSVFRSFLKVEDYDRLRYLAPLALCLAVILFFPSSLTVLILTAVFASFAFNRKETLRVNLGVTAGYYIVLAGLVIIAGAFFVGRNYLADIYYRLSVRDAAGNRLLQAYQEAQRSVSLNSSSEAYLNTLGNISFNLARALSDSPQATESAVTGQIESLTNDALTLGAKSAELNPFSAANWNQLGFLYENLSGANPELREQALASYQRAMSLDPQNPQIRVNIGNLLYSAGQKQDSLNFFSQAANLKPDWYLPHFSIGSLLREAGQNSQSAQSFRQALNFAPAGSQDYETIRKLYEAVSELAAKEASPSTSITPEPVKEK